MNRCKDIHLYSPFFGTTECHQTCALCEGPEPTQCLQCGKGLVLDPNTMMCGVTGDSDCPPRTFLQNNQFTCQACHRLCQSCEGPGPFDCQTCALPNFLHSMNEWHFSLSTSNVMKTSLFVMLVICKCLGLALNPTNKSEIC